MRRLEAVGAVVASLLLSGGFAAAYVDGPPPGYSGGFGEPTCHVCHFDQVLDDSAGRLEVQGFPEAFEPGARYEVGVTVARPGTARAGFQLTVRFSGGTRAGQQAGHLSGGEEGVGVVEDASGVQYARQGREGSPVAADGIARWIVRWEAPAEAEGEVSLHVAANAANDDASELGDFVYVGEWRSRSRGAR
ncbi:MAG: choice-of-anchor V domain-containing protein [Deferrisomatales bacterium]|nr:choice-of-anchor V domain-containing protein [Deferrisomatales bacterium]